MRTRVLQLVRPHLGASPGNLEALRMYYSMFRVAYLYTRVQESFRAKTSSFLDS